MKVTAFDTSKREIKKTLNDRAKHYREIGLFLSCREYVGAIEKTCFQRQKKLLIGILGRNMKIHRKGVSYFTIVPDNLVAYTVI